MSSPLWEYAMLAAWLEGYSDGLPTYHETEKIRIKDASKLLLEVYEQKMKENEKWKMNTSDQA